MVASILHALQFGCTYGYFLFLLMQILPPKFYNSTINSDYFVTNIDQAKQQHSKIWVVLLLYIVLKDQCARFSSSPRSLK